MKKTTVKIRPVCAGAKNETKLRLNWVNRELYIGKVPFGWYGIYKNCDLWDKDENDPGSTYMIDYAGHKGDLLTRVLNKRVAIQKLEAEAKKFIANLFSEDEPEGIGQ